MKSKASFFSISKPLILENLRRFWAIPVLSFLVYFLSGVFPILMTYNKINNIARYIELSLNNMQPFFMFAHLIFPIMAAVIVFKYLQSTSAVSMMHSMPFTRMKLFNSSVVSGLILILVPIFLNGIILLAISKPAYYQYGTEMGLMTNTVNLFARSEILNWIWVSAVMVIFIYAVSIFSGIISGNSLMHFAMCLFFNFIAPGLYAIFVAYFSKFLFGFDTSGSWIDFAMSISPFLNALQKSGDFSLGVTIYYIITFLILIALSAFLYKRRKLERAGDSLVFGFMEPIICYLIAFLGMTLLGFYFEVLGDSIFYFYAGLAAGTIIFFIIGQMIVKKTPRIFNSKGLRSFIIYGIIAIFLMVSLNMDVTGFEKRVPNTKDVKSFIMDENFRFGSSMHYYNRFYYSPMEPIFEDVENIKAITAFHQSVVENKNHFENLGNVYGINFGIEYDPENAFSINRRYVIDYEFYRNNPELKKIYESKEYKTIYSIKNIQFEQLKSIYLNSTDHRDSVEIKNEQEMQELLDAIERDFQAQSFEDRVSLKRNYATAEISFTYKDQESDTPERLLDGSINLSITDNYKNTITWLENHGYSENFEQRAELVEYIEIFHHQQALDGGYDTRTPDMAYQGKSLKITDPEKIQEILDTYEINNIDYESYYHGRIVYKGTYPEHIDGGPEAMWMYEEKGIYDYSTSFYLNEGNIPNYVLEYFQ